VADLDGDGAQDFAVVSLDGDVVFFPHVTAGEPVNVLRVALPPGGAFAGPLTVTASDGRKQNTWVASPGADAFLSRPGAGAVEFSWQLPGGEVQKKSIDVENKSVRFVLPVGKPAGK
jgi:hypothetical protein